MLNFRTGMYNRLELKAELMSSSMFIMLPRKGQPEKTQVYYVVMVIFISGTFSRGFERCTN